MSIRLNEADWIAIEQEACRRSLSEFIRLAWKVIEPGSNYVHGWHIDAMAEHLEAVTTGQIKRLLINCPPGVMKSLMVGVFWPMWEWGPMKIPHMRYVAASHAQELAMRDNLRSRRLFKSEFYQKRWPCAIAEDQNAKLKFENEHFGFRQAAAAASMTGARGDRVIVDDPHNVEGALSDAHRETTIRWFAETVPTRLNSPENSAIVVIMQRLHEMDVSGHILDSELGYEHLMLPMEFDPERRCFVESTGFTDPRTEDGELLFPERFPRHVVERDKKALASSDGDSAVAGQFQQSPTPRGGGRIQADRLEIDEPGLIIQKIRYWDKAGTKATSKKTQKSARTAGVLLGLEDTGRVFVLNVVAGRWEAAEREKVIRETAILDGVDVQVYVEQEPGSGGKESAENTIRNTLMGFAAYAERPSGAKEVRAEPFAAQVAAGNVRLAPGSWNTEFIGECRSFPVGRLKDIVDATSGAFNKLTLSNVQPRLRVVG